MRKCAGFICWVHRSSPLCSSWQNEPRLWTREARHIMERTLSRVPITRRGQTCSPRMRVAFLGNLILSWIESTWFQLARNVVWGGLNKEKLLTHQIWLPGTLIPTRFTQGKANQRFLVPFSTFLRRKANFKTLGPKGQASACPWSPPASLIQAVLPLNSTELHYLPIRPTLWDDHLLHLD